MPARTAVLLQPRPRSCVECLRAPLDASDISRVLLPLTARGWLWQRQLKISQRIEAATDGVAASIIVLCRMSARTAIVLKPRP